MEDVQPASSSMEDVQPASSSSPLSSSMIASDLFGGKESSASANTSSPGIFSSLFPRPASTMVMGRDSSHFDSFGLWKRQNPELQVSNTKHVPADRIDQGGGSENKSIPNKDKISAYPDETVEPCFLSSSLYYGGRDVYSHSNTQASGTPAICSLTQLCDQNIISSKRLMERTPMRAMEMMHQEEIGGKDRSITKAFAPSARALTFYQGT